MVHSIWKYHAEELAWGDIGYNFLVDKYGQMFEGRQKSLPEPGSYSLPTTDSVEAGHAYGYNKGTLGISAMGNYTRTARFADPSLVVEPMAQLIAWKFNLAGLDVVDETGARVASGIVSPGTYTTYPAGASLPRIFLHRDVHATSCQARSRTPPSSTGSTTESSPFHLEPPTRWGSNSPCRRTTLASRSTQS